ncbi:MAG: PRC-barrel domain-containing protein [Candidatus Pacebacteria bacterium]|nr:PRC-barrel domain-containing protein [Candidatus Paceibacterota bacterium]
MKLNYGSRVYSSDDQELGVVKEVVVDPRSRMVTHVVIQSGLLFTSDRLICTDLIATTTDDRIILKETAAKLEQELADEYREDEYVPMEDETIRERHGVGGRAWVYPRAALPVAVSTYQSVIPPGIGPLPPEPDVAVPFEEITLEQGCLVRTSDGKRIGSVDELITDDNDNITHILIREGTFFTVPKRIPVDWVAGMEEEEIVLAVDARTVDRLPEPNQS